MKIIDTHAHYDDEAFREDRDVLLNELLQEKIERIVNIGASMESCKATVELIEKNDNIYGVLEVHPSETGPLTESDLEWIRNHAKNPKCVAIGEIGLDYYWDEPNREIQKTWFRKQLQIAKELDMPVVIHSRDAAEDTIKILKEEISQTTKGVIHCYSYSKELLPTFLNMGFYIGIGGVVTFKNAKKLREVIEYLPLDKIVIETDCPYLSPEPFRGKRNDSSKLEYVIKAIAEIKGISEEEVIVTTSKNAHLLYPNLK